VGLESLVETLVITGCVMISFVSDVWTDLGCFAIDFLGVVLVMNSCGDNRKWAWIP
jgi:hypothetical protein